MKGPLLLPFYRFTRLSPPSRASPATAVSVTDRDVDGSEVVSPAAMPALLCHPASSRDLDGESGD